MLTVYPTTWFLNSFQCGAGARYGDEICVNMTSSKTLKKVEITLLRNTSADDYLVLVLPCLETQSQKFYGTLR